MIKDGLTLTESLIQCYQEYIYTLDAIYSKVHTITGNTYCIYTTLH